MCRLAADLERPRPGKTDVPPALPVAVDRQTVAVDEPVRQSVLDTDHTIVKRPRRFTGCAACCSIVFTDEPMRVVMSAVGTMGNALPFLGWARALAARGHNVVVLGSPYLKSTVERYPLPFFPVDSLQGQTPSSTAARPRQTRALLRQLISESGLLTEQMIQAMRQAHEPGRTVFITTGWQFAGRLARDLFNAPLITAVLQPGFMPRAATRPIRRMVERLIASRVDRRLLKSLNPLRDQLGLPAIDQVTAQWCWSPDLIVGLFPSWFSDYERSWPVQTILTEFPLFVGDQPAAQEAELQAFLDRGPAPLVFSESTLASSDAGESPFAQAMEVAERLKRRAILLTTNAANVPASRPDSIGYFGYVPLSRLLPHAAAFIHHGGLGSLSQGLAAGVPQLTIPRFMDQPDNSRRLEQLGVSYNLKPKRVSTDALTWAVRLLVRDQAVLRRAQECAVRIRQQPPFESACEAVEQLGRWRKVAA
jgi:rhamnosyltransferase subunit B